MPRKRKNPEEQEFAYMKVRHIDFRSQLRIDSSQITSEENQNNRDTQDVPLEVHQNEDCVEETRNEEPYNYVPDEADSIEDILDQIEDTMGQVEETMDQFGGEEIFEGVSEEEDENNTEKSSDFNDDSEDYFGDDLNMSHLSRRINEYSTLTIYDVLKMVQAAMGANSLTYTAVIDFIKIINLVIGNKAIPESEYIFKKVCTQGINFKRNFFCKDCRTKIENTNDKTCLKCNSNDTKNFFISIPIKDNLIKVISANFSAIENWKDNVSRQHEVSDIHNSNWYNSVKHINNGNIFTINVNTDGVAIFNASRKKSLWPILITINDLPLNRRFEKKNVLSAGYWMSDIEVDIDLFFEPFLAELNDLFTNGINLKNDNFKIVVACCCLDSVARAKFLKMKQFNGQYGCTYCLQKSSNSRYPFKESLILRTYQHYKDCNESIISLTNNEQNKDMTSIMGVKGLCSMTKCPQFDPMSQVPVDSMHNVFLGVTKLFIKIWFDSKYCDKDFYIPPSYRLLIDQKIKGLQTFSECGRIPRNITDYKKWKANEFYNWLFIYAKYCLANGILNGSHYRHFLLFADCMEKLHSSYISPEQLIQVESDLKQFVRTFEKFYGKECMVYNVHLVLHLTDSVRQFGPLNNFSLFVYENFNGVLGNFLRGPNGPLIQLSVRHFAYFKINYGNDKRMNAQAFNFCKEVMMKKSTSYKKSNDRKKFKIVKIQNNTYKSFKKYFVANKTIGIFNKENKTKFNECYIYLKEIFIRIEKILTNNANKLFVLGSPIITQQFGHIPNYYQISSIQEPIIYEIEKDFCKCFFYQIDEQTSALTIIKNLLIVD